LWVKRLGLRVAGIGIGIDVVKADPDFDIEPDTDGSPTCKERYISRSADPEPVSSGYITVRPENQSLCSGRL
jgi:hypothetical protein